MRVCVLSHSGHVQLFVTPWTVACQAPLSVGFSKQEYKSELPCPPLGDLHTPGTEPTSLMFVFWRYPCIVLHCLWALIISVKSIISLIIVPLEIMCLSGCLFLCFSDVLLWCIRLGVIFLFILLGAPWIYRLMWFFFFFFSFGLFLAILLSFCFTVSFFTFWEPSYMCVRFFIHVSCIFCTPFCIFYPLFSLLNISIDFFWVNKTFETIRVNKKFP